MYDNEVDKILKAWEDANRLAEATKDDPELYMEYLELQRELIEQAKNIIEKLTKN